jgi:phage terminase small subunit
MAAIIKGKHITLVPRLVAPDTLSPQAKAIFVHTVKNVDPSHFSEVDLPLLEGYANSAALATEAAQRLDADGAVGGDGKPSAWLGVSEKAIKQLVALSARLRICPQSRFDRLGAGANSRNQPLAHIDWDKHDSDGLLA